MVSLLGTCRVCVIDPVSSGGRESASVPKSLLPRDIKLVTLRHGSAGERTFTK